MQVGACCSSEAATRDGQIKMSFPMGISTLEHSGLFVGLDPVDQGLLGLVGNVREVLLCVAGF
jgi:hypothetical protein